MKSFYFKLTAALIFLFSIPIAAQDLANTQITARTVSVISYGGGPCQEGGGSIFNPNPEEEFSAKVKMVVSRDNFSFTLSSDCLQSSGNGNQTYGVNKEIGVGVNDLQTVRFKLEAWENDYFGGLCNYNPNFDDCYINIASNKILYRQEPPSTPGNFDITTNIFGNGIKHTTSVKYNWHYTNNDNKGLILNENVTYRNLPVNKINAIEVLLLAGETYTFETIEGGDTYLRLYEPNGYSIVAEDDNGGTGELSKIVFLATSSGTHFIEVTNASRTPLSHATQLALSQNTFPAPNSANTAITAHTKSVTSYGDGPCQEGGYESIEEYRAFVGMTLTSGRYVTGCLRGLGEGRSQTYGINQFIAENELNVKQTLQFSLSAWESDTVDEFVCSYDQYFDDCAIDDNTPNIFYRQQTPSSSGDFNLDSNIFGNSNTHAARVKYDWRYTTASSSPLDPQFFETYTRNMPVNQINAIAVSLLAGENYTFETVTGGDTYLRVYAPNGYNIVAQDDNGGSGGFSKIVYTAKSTGTFFIEVTNAFRSPVSMATQLEITRNFSNMAQTFITARTELVRSIDYSDCAEEVNRYDVSDNINLEEEFTAYVRMSLTSGTHSTPCMETDGNNIQDYGFNVLIGVNKLHSFQTLQFQLEAWENDSDERCSFGNSGIGLIRQYDDCYLHESNSPILYRQQWPNYSGASNSATSFFGDDNTHTARVRYDWRYAVGSSIPLTLQDCETYTGILPSSEINAFAVDIQTGEAYTFETVQGGDTYLRLYSPNGYTIIAEDENGGSAGFSKIIYTAASSGVYFIEVTKDGNRNPVPIDTQLNILKNNIEPTITCNNPITVGNDPGVCTYTVVGTEYDATFTDYCSNGSITNDYNNAASLVGAIFNKGNTTVTWTVDDGNGQVQNCTTIITIEDNEDPLISCILNQERYVDPYQTYYTVDSTEFDATATDNCEVASITYIGGSPSTSGSSMHGVALSLGINNMNWTAVDVNENDSNCATTVEVYKRPTSLIYNGDLDKQYSDSVDLSATLTDDISPGGGVEGKTVKFTIGSQSTTAITDASGVASTILIVTQDPASTYTVNAEFIEDASYLGSSDSQFFDITQEDAVVEYTGQSLQATPSSNSSEATIVLSANIQDIAINPSNTLYDVYQGDILNARLKFVDREGTFDSGWLNIVNLIDPVTGTASYEWETSISGNNTSESFTIGIIVDTGFYIRNSREDDTVVTIYIPTGDFITGGGYILPIASAGQYASTEGLKTNLGFNVKYNKKGTSLKGHMNIIFRRLESDGIHIYQIKGNAIQSLGVDVSDENAKFATFITKANLKDITDPLFPISLGGNLTLKVDMTDRGEPGNFDSVALSLTEEGTLLFSSNWTGILTNEMQLAGGNLVVHSGFSSSTTSKAVEPILTAEFDDIELVSWPNPSDDYFNIKLNSKNTVDVICIRIFDAKGRFVIEKTGMPNKNYKIGEGMQAGLYFINVVQGSKSKNVQLIKY